jgi:DNA-binding transcriptional LysR family regulator
VALKTDLDGGLLERAIAAYNHEQAAVPIEVMLGGWGEQPQLLRDGHADVALLYQPFDDRGLDSELLLEEPQLVALPTGNPLAARRELRVADLQAEYQPSGPYIWRPRQAGQEPPHVTDMSGLLRQIELDQVIAVLPSSVTARFRRPQIRYRPVVDAPPRALSVAWPRSSSSLATATFIRVVTELASAHRLATDQPASPLMPPCNNMEPSGPTRKIACTSQRTDSHRLLEFSAPARGDAGLV